MHAGRTNSTLWKMSQQEALWLPLRQDLAGRCSMQGLWVENLEGIFTQRWAAMNEYQKLQKIGPKVKQNTQRACAACHDGNAKTECL